MDTQRSAQHPPPQDAEATTRAWAGEDPVAPTPLPPECQEAIRHLREAIQAGRPWPLALLEAMGMWTAPQEVRGGRLYRYLIDGESFDWLLLAERLCDAVDGLIPWEERARLLREGRFPQEVPEAEFRRLLGPSKYRAYLNYRYGVTVEQALWRVVEAEVRKERLSRALPPNVDVSDEVFTRLYGEPREALLRQFRQEKGYPQHQRLSPGEEKEFTYWLFKLRLRRNEKARVASDTRKALEWLRHHTP